MHTHTSRLDFGCDFAAVQLATALLRQTPRVGLLEAVPQRLDLLHPFPFRQLGRIPQLEKLWGELHQPSGLDHDDFSHVFLGGQHQFVVAYDVWIVVEECGRWVDVDWHTAPLRRDP